MIEIKTEKLVERGEKMRKIIAIDGVMENEDLPKEYLNGYPCVKNNCEKSLVILDEKEKGYVAAYSFVIGHIYTERCFREVLKVMYAAGDRLHQLRQKEKELKKTWRGDDTFLV
ncbi:MAG TPA: hypothetical protein VFD17_07205 [Clostridia bacterium]|nr:hypothetical protein [Clostridia bacterium]